MAPWVTCRGSSRSRRRRRGSSRASATSPSTSRSSARSSRSPTSSPSSTSSESASSDASSLRESRSPSGCPSFAGPGAIGVPRASTIAAAPVALSARLLNSCIVYLSPMDLRTRVTILSESADRDGPPGAPVSAGNLSPSPGSPVGITRVTYPGHGATRLMRVMQTNACSLSCGYCPTFCGGKVRRTYLSPEEVARVFIDAHRAGQADGLFLTSGVPGRPSKMTDRMLAAVDLLRRSEGFRGYIHLKLLPGAEPAQVEAAVRLASRVSVNLEAPGPAYVQALAREKDFAGDLLPNLELAGRLMLERQRARTPSTFAAAGTTTQFVVGAAGERDREILGVVTALERRRLLHHAHFSAFQPVVGTPFEGRAPTPATREQRLYQAEHLVRQYGFDYDELVFAADG